MLSLTPLLTSLSVFEKINPNMFCYDSKEKYIFLIVIFMYLITLCPSDAETYYGCHILILEDGVKILHYRYDAESNRLDTPSIKITAFENLDPSGHRFPAITNLADNLRESFKKSEIYNSLPDLPANLLVTVKLPYTFKYMHIQKKWYFNEVLKTSGEYFRLNSSSLNPTKSFLFERTPMLEAIMNYYNWNFDLNAFKLNIMQVIHFDENGITMLYFVQSEELRYNDEDGAFLHRFYTNLEPTGNYVYANHIACVTVEIIQSLMIIRYITDEIFRPQVGNFIGIYEYPCLSDKEIYEFIISQEDHIHHCIKDYISEYFKKSSFKIHGNFNYLKCKRLMKKVLVKINICSTQESCEYYLTDKIYRRPMSRYFTLAGDFYGLKYNAKPLGLYKIEEQIKRRLNDELNFCDKEHIHFCLKNILLFVFSEIFRSELHQQYKVFFVFTISQLQGGNAGAFFLDKRVRKIYPSMHMTKFGKAGGQYDQPV